MLSILDQRYLGYAEGFFELGMLQDANEALSKISPNGVGSSEVLKTRLEICKAAQTWAEAMQIACTLAKLEKNEAAWLIDWAYATRRAVSIHAAKEILVKAERCHPKEALIKYNLACYAAQMGHLYSAKAYVLQALSLDRSLRKLALEDTDLKPIWPCLSPLLLK
jgi:hypothetical protein